MTDMYLQNLGFASLQQGTNKSRPPFEKAWRYRHDHLAQDGAELFIEHPFGINRCRVSALAAPLRQQDVFAETALQDGPALEAAVAAFFLAHGGQAGLVVPLLLDQFRPYRRQR